MASYLTFAMAIVAVFLALQPPTIQGANGACCNCACTLKWPPESNYCFCGGLWEGSCPSACKNCSCNEIGYCTCLDGFTIKYCDCMADSCSGFSDPACSAARMI